MVRPDLEPSPLDREYLPIRAKILEIAAALDRIQRSSTEELADLRWAQLQSGIQLLQSDDPERAEQVQLLFSRPYDAHWRESLGV
ncbi:MAG: hypothetical protein ACR2NM_10770 [Bythopirellula sp.]